MLQLLRQSESPRRRVVRTIDSDERHHSNTRATERVEIELKSELKTDLTADIRRRRDGRLIQRRVERETIQRIPTAAVVLRSESRRRGESRRDGDVERRVHRDAPYAVNWKRSRNPDGNDADAEADTRSRDCAYPVRSVL